MGRGQKPAKSKEAKPPVARKSPKDDDSRVGELEKRLAEALEQLQTRDRELAEAREQLTAAHAQVSESHEQQTATSEILRVIASSPTDLQPAFNVIASSALRLCDGVASLVFRYDGALIHLAASDSAEGIDLQVIRHNFPAPPERATFASRVVTVARPLYIADIEHDPDAPSGLVEFARANGFRSIFAGPMRRDEQTIGVIAVTHRNVGGFTPEQGALLKTFADQAVIAIENVRLFTELQASNHELTTALDTQTATSDILRVISRSQTDVQPVFDTILVSAIRLLTGFTGALTRLDGDQITLVALTSTDDASDAAVRAAFPQWLHAGGAHPQTARDRVPLNVADAHSDARLMGPEGTYAKVRGYQSLVVVPLLRHDEAIGTLSVTRREPGGFTDDEIALLQTFADQAVIAIENVRLFKELEARNAELTETIARQTATGEVLHAISQAQTDAQPVFEIIARSARRLCEAAYGQVQLYDGELIHLAALEMANPEGDQPIRTVYPLRVGDGSAGGRAISTRTVVQIPDLLDERAYAFKKAWEASGLRSLLAVPMLRDGEPLGTIGIGRVEPGPFSQTQINLLQTFAEQAVIAIENVRLFNELQARTADLTRSVGQLTALGEVGQAVSSSLDLETVLTTIVSRAVQLSGLDGGVIFEYDEAAEEFAQRAATDPAGALAEARRTARIGKGEGVVGRTAVTLRPAQVPDITVAGAYEGRLRDTLIEAGVRAVLAVPMLREGHLIGCLAVTRNAPGDFPPETRELLRTFATQSALAIQNARLFRELADKSRQLEIASQHKSEFLANMSHELRTPLNAIIGFSEVLSERMFGELNEKQEEYLKDIYASGTHLLSLINDILDLSKIEAGRMELELTDFDLHQAIENALILVRERAGRRSITLQTNIDERLGEVRADERKIRQVALNLLSNAIKFTPEGGRIEVRAGPVDGSVEVSVSDTGVGIAPEDQNTVFEEFRQVGTAEKKAEGTGLGLTLCRKFIELHGGRISVKSQVGVGSTFTFTIPVRPSERSASAG
jgi:two-component system, NtrC family, sensor kinase